MLLDIKKTIRIFWWNHGVNDYILIYLFFAIKEFPKGFLRNVSEWLIQGSNFNLTGKQHSNIQVIILLPLWHSRKVYYGIAKLSLVWCVSIGNCPEGAWGAAATPDKENNSFTQGNQFKMHTSLCFMQDCGIVWPSYRAKRPLRFLSTL